MKAIFLDRDGVVNKYPGDTKYVTCLKEFRMLPNSAKAIAGLSRADFKIFVVSNQGGVNKGLFTRDTLDKITETMLAKIKAAGGRINAVYYCIHRSEENCTCRKPKTGLVGLALKEHPEVNLKHSFFIGDTIRDVLTAKSAGCRSILVLSGKEKLTNRKNWEAQPDFIFSNLAAAARFILKH
jgi:histidinol-phosphate phosphatase family protein